MTMTREAEIRRLITKIFSVAKELTKLTGRPFTLDGLLLGSLGEVFAETNYGIKLHPPGRKKHDGIWRGREVQVKITQRQTVDLTGEYDLLLVLHVTANGRIEEIYNGDGVRPWSSLSHRKLTKGGWKSISLTQLRKLQKEVDPSDRIPKMV